MMLTRQDIERNREKIRCLQKTIKQRNVMVELFHEYVEGTRTLDVAGVAEENSKTLMAIINIRVNIAKGETSKKDHALSNTMNGLVSYKHLGETMVERMQHFADSNSPNYGKYCQRWLRKHFGFTYLDYHAKRRKHAEEIRQSEIAYHEEQLKDLQHGT